MHIAGGAEARAQWHFTDPSRRSFLWDTFLESSSPENLGAYLHPEQDSYSHAGFGPNLGQAWPPWTGTSVDKTYNDPGKADRMAQDTFSHLTAANPQLSGSDANYAPLDWKVVSPYIQRFNRARTPAEKQKVLNELNGVAQRNVDGQKRREADRQRTGGCSAEFASCQ